MLKQEVTSVLTKHDKSAGEVIRKVINSAVDDIARKFVKASQRSDLIFGWWAETQRSDQKTLQTMEMEKHKHVSPRKPAKTVTTTTQKVKKAARTYKNNQSTSPRTRSKSKGNNGKS
jgi:hypothetical protein